MLGWFKLFLLHIWKRNEVSGKLSKFADDTLLYTKNTKLEYNNLQIYKFQHGKKNVSKSIFHNYKTLSLSIKTQEKDLEMFCPEWN